MNYRDWLQVLGALTIAYYMAQQAGQGVPVPWSHLEERGDEEIYFEGMVVRRKKGQAWPAGLQPPQGPLTEG
jgi:hypothetical protein